MLLGSLREIRRDPLGFVVRLGRTYDGVARYRIANRRFFLVTHPDGVRRVLHENHRNYTRESSVSWDNIRLALGQSLLTGDGESWLSRRRLMQPAFHHRCVAGFAALMARETLAMLDRWAVFADRAQPVDVGAEVTRLTVEILIGTLFSGDVRSKVDAILHATTVQNTDMNLRFTIPFYPPPGVPTPHNRRLRNALGTLDEIIHDLIEEHRRHKEPVNDLLTLLIAARDEETGAAMSDRELRDELISLFFAGHETTANTLIWTLYLLATHPDVAQRMWAEIAVGPDDFRSLPYTQMVISEVLRLYPPAWITTRTAKADDEICGYRIPAQSQVSLCNYATHRDPRYWEEPDRFDPERFSPGRTKGRPRYAYFPFLGGPHQCIGRDFALLEIQLILGMVARRYRLELAAGCVITPRPLITLRPGGPLTMTVRTI